MSFTDPMSFTYNAVAKALVRTNQDGSGSDFYLDGGTRKFTAAVRHTIPARGGFGESHMLRLDADEHDANGLYLRRNSAWIVAKTFDATQNTVDLGYTLNSLVAFLTTTQVGKLIAREN